jgi:hypothetical protein
MDDIRSLLAKKPIQDIIPPPGAKKDRSTERGEWLEKFCKRLNPGRVGKMKPLTMARMGFLLQGVPTSDLHAFWKQCESAKSFDKYFWYSVNPKKHQKDI